MSNCPECGAEGRGGRKFCWNCGHPVAIAPVPEQLAPEPAGPPAEIAALEHQCPTCNRRYPPDVKFCKVDGTPLRALAPVPEPDTDPTDEPAKSSGEIAPSETNGHEEPEDDFSAESPLPTASPAPPSLPDAGRAYCPKCGGVFPPTLRFCERDGAPLDPDPPENPAPDLEEDTYAPDVTPSGSPWLLPTGILVLLLAASGALYWFGTNRQTDIVAPPSTTSTEVAASENGAQATTTPGLLGTYRSHMADQDIVLVIDGSVAVPLGSTQGTIEYVNRVNGGTCDAKLVPVEAEGPGGGTGDTVRFRQDPIPGLPACPRPIPVTARIDRLPSDGAIVGSSVRLEWTDPDDGHLLMSGSLERDPVD